MPEQHPTVNLGKETRRDIAAAIRDLSRQFREQRDEAKSRTFSDNLAHNIASGATIRESVSEAISVSAERKREQFKKSIDPVNIVKKLTGGSKIAAVLAGRVLGRTGNTLRAGADIPQVTAPISEYSPTAAAPDASTSPTQVSGGRTETVLSDMLKYMGLITLQVTAIADKMGAHGVARNKRGQYTDLAAPQYKMLKDIKNLLILDHKEDKKFQKASLTTELEQQRLLREGEELRRAALNESEKQADLARAQGYRARFGHGPRQLDHMGMNRFTDAEEQERQGDAHSGGILGPMMTGLASVLGIEGLLHGKGLAKTAMKLGGSALNAMKSPIKAIGAGLGAGSALLKHPIESVKSAVAAVKSFAGVGAKVAGVGAAAAAPKIIEAAAGGTGRKLAGTMAEKLAGAAAAPASKGIAGVVGKGGAAIGATVKKLMPKMLGKYGSKLAGMTIPGIGTLIGAGLTASSILEGDWIGAGINAAGMIPYAGLATVPVMIAREIYKDAYDGADPFTDPLRGERMPPLVAAVQKEVGDWMTGNEEKPTAAALSETTPPTVAPVPVPVPPTLDTPRIAPPESPVSAPGDIPLPKIGAQGIEKLSREGRMGSSAMHDRIDAAPPNSIINMMNQTHNNIMNHTTQKIVPSRNTESSFLQRQFLAGSTS